MKTFYCLFALSIVCIVYSGCDPVHSRDCEAFSYDFNNWKSVNEMDSITFISSLGQEVKFHLTDIQLSEPYTESWIGGDCCDNDPADVTCRMRGDLFYHSPELGIDLKISFSQFEEFQQPLEEQSILVEYHFKTQDQEAYTYLHGLNIEPEFQLFSPHEMIDSLEVAGEVYHEVIQSTLDTAFLNVDPKISFWKVYLNRGNGIIQFNNTNGTAYYLKR